MSNKNVSPWRQTAASIIKAVIAENPGAEEKELRKAISAAYPFGSRQWHPYKIWLSEVKAQLRVKLMGKSPKDPPAQTNLFSTLSKVQ